MTLGAERMRDFFSGCKQSDEQLRVLIDLYRTVGAVIRSDQAQLAALLGFRETFLLAARFMPRPVGKNPYLQEMEIDWD